MFIPVTETQLQKVRLGPSPARVLRSDFEQGSCPLSTGGGRERKSSAFCEARRQDEPLSLPSMLQRAWFPGLLWSTQAEPTLPSTYYIYLLSVHKSSCSFSSLGSVAFTFLRRKSKGLWCLKDLLQCALEGTGLVKLALQIWAHPTVTDSHGPP